MLATVLSTVYNSKAIGHKRPCVTVTLPRGVLRHKQISNSGNSNIINV